MEPINSKTNKQISLEWDNISETRFEQINSNIDLSYNYILKPSVFNLVEVCNKRNVLDLGCGTGNLTNILADFSESVVGIDLSNESIRLAMRHFNNKGNLKFLNYSIEDFSELDQSGPFSLIVANMVLMDVTNLSKAIESIKNILLDGGHFVFTITHPCYWPTYWDYFDKKWFNYKDEQFIESQFKISLEKKGHKTTHIHRPLEQYINVLSKEGFVIEEMIEPVPTDNVLSLFPDKIKYPRFLGMRCRLL